MPTEAIIVTIVVSTLFTVFGLVLAWASHNAPPTFPETDGNRTDALPYGRQGMAAGAH